MVWESWGDQSYQSDETISLCRALKQFGACVRHLARCSGSEVSQGRTKQHQTGCTDEFHTFLCIEKIFHSELTRFVIGVQLNCLDSTAAITFHQFMTNLLDTMASMPRLHSLRRYAQQTSHFFTQSLFSQTPDHFEWHFFPPAICCRWSIATRTACGRARFRSRSERTGMSWCPAKSWATPGAGGRVSCLNKLCAKFYALVWASRNVQKE